MIQSNTVIQSALKSIEEHPLHHLEIEYRKRIWMLFGESAKGIGAKDISRKKRYLLAEKTVKFVCCVWINSFPESDLVSGILKISESVFCDDVEFDSIVKFYNKAWLKIEEMFSTDKYQDDHHQRAISVAMSAWKVLGITLFDEVNCDGTETVDTDSDVYRKDASYWAAIAYAGPEWDLENSDKNKRLEFWKWWLEEAVPQVLNLEE